MDLPRRKILFICSGLFVFNFILKIYFISYTDIGLDEPFTIYFSQRNITGIMEMLKNENNPPLHFIFTHFWIKLFGIGVYSVRLPSVIFSSATAVIIFLIGKKFSSLKTALVASLLFAGSTVHMFYAHDARVYAMFIFLFCCSLYLFLSTITLVDKTKKGPLIALTLINLLLCYVHFFGFIIVFTETLLCILLSPLRKNLKKIFLSSLIIILSYAWYIPIVWKRFIASSGGTWVPKPLLTDLYTMLWRFSNVPVVTVIFIVTILFVIFFKWKVVNEASKNTFKILLLFFLICYLGLFLLSFKLPVFIDRYLLFTSIFFYFLIAISMTTVFKSEKMSLIFSIVILILMFASVDLKRGKNQNVREMAENMKSESAQLKNIVITPEWYSLNFTYYYNRKWFSNAYHLNDTLASHSIFPVNSYNDLKSLDFSIPVMFVENNIENDSIRQFLNEKFSLREETDFKGGLKLLLYDVRKKEN